MDELTEYEAALIIENLEFADRQRWEQTRLMMYASVVPYSKKQLQPADILKFSWENTESDAINWTDEKIEKVEEKSAEFEQFIKSMINT